MKDTKKVSDEDRKDSVTAEPDVAGDATKQKQGIPEDYTLTVDMDWNNQVDVWYLDKKDPYYKYRWLRKDQSNMTKKTSNLLFQGGGWQVCPKSHLLRVGICKEDELAPDGTLVRGEHVLAFMPRKYYDEKERYKKTQADAPIKAINRTLEHGDPNNPELAGRGHKNVKGLQTAKDLGMKTS